MARISGGRTLKQEAPRRKTSKKRQEHIFIVCVSSLQRRSRTENKAVPSTKEEATVHTWSLHRTPPQPVQNCPTTDTSLASQPLLVSPLMPATSTNNGQNEGKTNCQGPALNLQTHYLPRTQHADFTAHHPDLSTTGPSPDTLPASQKLSALQHVSETKKNSQKDQKNCQGSSLNSKPYHSPAENNSSPPRKDQTKIARDPP